MLNAEWEDPGQRPPASVFNRGSTELVEVKSQVGNRNFIELLCAHQGRVVAVDEDGGGVLVEPVIHVTYNGLIVVSGVWGCTRRIQERLPVEQAQADLGLNDVLRRSRRRPVLPGGSGDAGEEEGAQLGGCSIGVGQAQAVGSDSKPAGRVEEDDASGDVDQRRRRGVVTSGRARVKVVAE